MGNASSGRANTADKGGEEERPRVKRCRGDVEDLPPALQVLTSSDIVPKILDCLDWPSKGRAACVCRQWRHLAASAEASLSAGKCWLTWQQPWPPEGPVLRHVQRCKLPLCTDRLHLVDFNWLQLPALTAVHIEARLTTIPKGSCTVYWNNKTVKGLSVTVLHSIEHCLAHERFSDHSCLGMSVVSSCLETLCVRAVVVETGLLAYQGYSPEPFYSGLWLAFGVSIHLRLFSVPQLRQLLVCSQKVTVCSDQRAGGRPKMKLSGLRAACLTDRFGVEGVSHSSCAELQEIFQVREASDPSELRGRLQLASDNHTMQLLQTYFEHDCCPCM